MRALRRVSAEARLVENGCLKNEEKWLEFVESIQLYFTEGPVPIRWLRPGEIVARPQFINQEPIAGDVRQGSIGNCWALSAASVLAQYGPLFYRVVPPDQGDQLRLGSTSSDNEPISSRQLRFGI
ncbi:hypothetical protein niasHT_000858 [Heterodera trifolii]|uniref:Calpain catalytic domain-containing protein n=1 Tax=Heterodera trifolii TaxID=157864 RepID=A0ABD2MEP8_9BILA